MLCGGPQRLAKRSVTQLQVLLSCKIKTAGNSNHRHNFPSRLQSSLSSQGQKQVFLCSQTWDCECRMRTTSACLPQHASLSASSSAPQWIWLSLRGGGAWGVVAVGGAQGKWQREIWQWAATAKVVTGSTWCGGVWCLDCHTLPWHPTSSATPLSGTHQRDKADLGYWFKKMMKGPTSGKVGDLDLWADFSKCNSTLKSFGGHLLKL